MVEVATVANALSVQTVAAPQTVGAATENVQYEVVDYYLAQYDYLVASVVWEAGIVNVLHAALAKQVFVT